MAQYNNSTNNLFRNQLVTSTATNYTVLGTDTIIEVTDNTAQRTITLPAPVASNAGKFIYIKDAAGTAGSANNIIVAPASGTIDGVASKSITQNYGWMFVYNDGTSYYVLDNSGAAPFAWNAVAGTSQAIAANSGYYCQNAGLTTLSLPVANCPAGQVIAVTAVGAGGFTISQGTGQQIVFGNQSSTSGTGGSLASSAIGDSVYLLCTVTASASAGTFQVINAVGNILIS